MADSLEVKKAKDSTAIRAIERKEKLSAWNDYIGFAVTKLVGFGCLGVGLVEMLRPELLSLSLTYPGPVAGAGIALLVGPKTVNMLAKIFNVLKS